MHGIIVSISYGARCLPFERVRLSSTQLETPITHYAGRLRSQSMDTIHRHTISEGLNLDVVGTKL